MRYLTTTEAAALLHLDPSPVRLLCQRGRINTIRIGNTYAISDRELARFAAIPRRAGRPRRGQTAFPQTATKMPSSKAYCPASSLICQPASLIQRTCGARRTWIWISRSPGRPFACSPYSGRGASAGGCRPCLRRVGDSERTRTTSRPVAEMGRPSGEGCELSRSASHSRPVFTSSRDFDCETAIQDCRYRPAMRKQQATCGRRASSKERFSTCGADATGVPELLLRAGQGRRLCWVAG